MESLNASITIYMDTWQKIARNQRSRKTLGSVINTNKQDTLLKIAGQDKR